MNIYGGNIEDAFSSDYRIGLLQSLDAAMGSKTPSCKQFEDGLSSQNGTAPELAGYIGAGISKRLSNQSTNELANSSTAHPGAEGAKGDDWRSKPGAEGAKGADGRIRMAVPLKPCLVPGSGL